jgi:hypothetical protein
MESTPAVLSVGARVIELGFRFIWNHGFLPCLMTSSMLVIPLTVSGGVPYLVEQGEHTKYIIQRSRLDACGLKIRRGQIVLRNFTTDAAPGDISSHEETGVTTDSTTHGTVKEDEPECAMNLDEFIPEEEEATTDPDSDNPLIDLGDSSSDDDLVGDYLRDLVQQKFPIPVVHNACTHVA